MEVFDGAGRGRIPRYKAYAGPAVLSQGFRPFFLLAGLWAVAGMLMWSGAILRGVPLPTAFQPSVWHAHAMLFGFVGAAKAGFLTTAVPNWTGRMPIQGAPLAALAGLWVVGRVACAVSGVIGAPAAMTLDLLFFLALPGVLAREVIAGRNWRNLPVVGATLVLAVANALVHLEPVAGLDSGYGLRLAIGAYAVPDGADRRADRAVLHPQLAGQARFPPPARPGLIGRPRRRRADRAGHARLDGAARPRGHRRAGRGGGARQRLAAWPLAGPPDLV